jgi:glyoxylase-like metal-dependent hydrolase (beta-lactamase superfamily II)
MNDTQTPATEFQIQVIPVTPLQQNASIIWSTKTKQAALVDPGGDRDRLIDAAKELQVDITAIWLTHGHIDHIGAATALKDHFGCPIIGPHKDDQFLLDHAETQGMKYGITEAQNVQPDRFLEEGDTIEVAGIEFSVLHCPGHSPGHVVFHRQEAQFAFVGDVLFRGSIGRTDLPGGNFDQLIESITQKLWPLGNDMQFLPGHGPGSTFGQERLDNGFVSDQVLGTGR